jgi:hypothetical protein
MSEPNAKLIKTKATTYRVSGESDSCEYVMSPRRCSMVLTWSTSACFIGQPLYGCKPEGLSAIYGTPILFHPQVWF